MADAIQVRGLTKSYGDFQALKGIDLTVESGTVLGLLGPNGAGKTTAVRILATVLKGDGGSAKVLGYDVASQPNEVRQRIGLAGQYAAVDPNLTGRENLRLTGRLAQLRPEIIKSRCDELLERFELTDAADRPVKTYSGGMRRRLDIGASLVQRPPVLFLDEPTTGLDPHSRNQLWDLIRELVSSGTTLLLTTQYLEEADQLADRIAVIDGGQVIANGTPDELKAQMGSTVLEMKYDDAQSAQTASQLLPQQYVDHLELNDEVIHLTTADSVNALADVLPQLREQGLAPERLTVREPSLDDVFLALTGKSTKTEDPSGPPKRGRRKKRGQQ